MTGNVVQLREEELPISTESFLETFQCPALVYDPTAKEILSANEPARLLLPDLRGSGDRPFGPFDLPAIETAIGRSLPRLPVRLEGRDLQVLLLPSSHRLGDETSAVRKAPKVPLPPLLQDLPIPAFSVDAEGFICERNAAFVDFFGERAAWSEKTSLTDLVPEDSRLELKQYLWGTAFRPVFNMDLSLLGRGGVRHDFRLHGRAFIDEAEEEPMGFQFVLEDKQDRRRLRKADRFLETIFDHCPVPLLYAEGPGVCRVNAACCRLFGKSNEDFCGEPIPFPLAGKRAPEPKSLPLPDQAQGGDSSFQEIRLPRGDGTSFEALVFVVPLGYEDGKPCTLAFIQDNGEHKEMQKIHMRNSLVVEQSPLILYQGVRSEKGLSLSYVSQNIRKFGYEPVEFDFIDSRVHPEDLPGLLEEIRRHPHKRDRKLTYRLRDAAGQYRWIRERNRTFPNRGDEPDTVVGLLEDITEQKRSEAEIRNNHRELQVRLGRLEKSWEQTIELLAAVTELRDPYTMGHQRRVAHLAGVIAREMGMDARREQEIVRAGLVHDIGKIQIPSDILSRPGKLGEHEFALIKEHTVIGAKLLQTIELPWPLHSIVRQHHERMDGSGYPEGLKGEEILPAARIIAVADVIEAMATHRPYRPALGIDAALEEIEKNAGIRYDADVAKVCLGLFREKGYRFPED